jgi:hypothetical protein
MVQQTAKRRKISYQQLKTLQTSLKKVATETGDNIESTPQRAKIELKVPSELAPAPEEAAGTVVTYMAPVSSASKQSVPTPLPGEDDADTVAQPEEGEFISTSELRRNRLTKAGWFNLGAGPSIYGELLTLLQTPSGAATSCNSDTSLVGMATACIFARRNLATVDDAVFIIARSMATCVDCLIV